MTVPDLHLLTCKDKKTGTWQGSEDVGHPSMADGKIVLYHDSTLVTSKVKGDCGCDVHWPVLDIDMPAMLIPSSTPGHYHLVIEKAMPWKDYRRLLKVLAKVGLIEPGFAEASIKLGYSAIRRPGVHKED